MQAQLNNTGIRPVSQAVAGHKPRGRGEVRRFNVCADCFNVNTKNLIRVKLLGGDMYFCHQHAALRGIA